MPCKELIEILIPLKERSEEISVICATNQAPNEVIQEKSCELLHLELNDSINKEQVERVLDFAEQNENVIVCCETGICISPALAYVIECTQVNPAMAVNLWQKNKHCPDERIIKFASEILENPKIEKFYKKWLG